MPLQGHARPAAALKPYSICFKDVGGLLTPERTRALVPIVLENIGDTPVEFREHGKHSLSLPPTLHLTLVEHSLYSWSHCSSSSLRVEKQEALMELLQVKSPVSTG